MVVVWCGDVWVNIVINKKSFIIILLQSSLSPYRRGERERWLCRRGERERERERRRRRGERDLDRERRLQNNNNNNNSNSSSADNDKS